MQRRFPQCPFARYADDAVVHCRSQEQAQEVMHAIASRLAEGGLTMHQASGASTENHHSRRLCGLAPRRA